MTDTNVLGLVETGNRPWIAAEVAAPNVPGHITEASTAITFSVMLPDATVSTPVSSPNADVAGPVAGTKVVTVNGVTTTLTTTTWYWKMPLLVLSGNYTVRWKSTAGVIAQDNSRLVVPTFAPFAVA